MTTAVKFPMPHPAYLLRSPADKARAWADLCLAAEALEQQQTGLGGSEAVQDGDR